jgi:hypothetical protein
MTVSKILGRINSCETLRKYMHAGGDMVARKELAPLAHMPDQLAYAEGRVAVLAARKGQVGYHGSHWPLTPWLKLVSSLKEVSVF